MEQLSDKNKMSNADYDGLMDHCALCIVLILFMHAGIGHR